jgi:hypothetical protein
MKNFSINDQQAKTGLYIILGLALVVIAYSISRDFAQAIDTTLENVGLKPSETDKQVKLEKEKAKATDYFSPTYYQQPPAGMKSRVLFPQIIDGIRDNIWDSVGIFKDISGVDYKAIQGELEKLKYKTEVSQLAYYFNAKYKKSLYAFLTEKLNPYAPDIILKAFNDNRKETLQTILTRLNNLPSGFYTR